MEAVLARGLQVLIALAGAYVVALWFVLVVWTFRDIEARSRSIVTQVFSTLLVVLFFIPGILLYMILRPKATLDEAFQRSLEEEYLLQDLEELPLCHQCQRYVEDDFILCPHCRAQLREPCQACKRLVNLRWALCPYCAAPQDGRAAEEAARVEAPAARWTAPGLRRRARPVPNSALPEPIEPFIALAAIDDAARSEDDEAVAAAVAQDDERNEVVAATAHTAPARVRPLDRAAVRRLDESELSDLDEDDDEPAPARVRVFHRARELGRAFTANGNGHAASGSADGATANGSAKTNGTRNGNSNAAASGRELSVLERLRLSATGGPARQAESDSAEDDEAETAYARTRAEGD